MEIVNKNKLYPDETTPLKEHFSGFTDVFIGLVPFFQSSSKISKAQSSKEILTLEQAQEKDELFKNIETLNGVIYSTSEEYPEDQEIIETGKPIFWNQIIKNTEIKDFRDLNKALMTSIGAYHKKQRREDTLKILNDYTEKSNIWHPTEGTFGVFVKQQIYNTLNDQKINEIVVIDEHYEDQRVLNLTNLNQSEFISKINFKDYYLYSKDKSILFSIGWDFFFFFISIDNSKIDEKKIESNFEGFWANELDSHLWTWKEGEIENLMNTKELKKSWWNKIMNK